MADGTRSRRRRLGAGRNRLGALPDDVLHHTITYLPVTEAARAALLASSWRHLWRSYPLVLKDTDIPEPARDAVVPRVLDDHPGRFRAVILFDCRLASLDRELPGWPRLLAEKRTEKLVLGYRWVVDQPNSVRLLPADILRCDSFQWLGLDFWTFPVDLSGRADVFLPHLRTLYIKKIVISDHDLEYLIAACPVLESLRLAFNSSKHVRLRSKSLRCALVGLSPHLVEEFTVVDTPLLERLFFYLPLNSVEVRIACATNLRVLGYLDTRTHKLQIGESVIREVKMLVSFLRCFPNVDTLHIESALHGPSVTANEPSVERHARFWQEISPICCLSSHVKKMVIHDFRGDQNEFEFVKSIVMNAQELQSLLAVSQEGILSADKVTEIKDEFQCLQFPTGISAVLQVSGTGLLLQKASNLTIDDPFNSFGGITDCSLQDLAVQFVGMPYLEIWLSFPTTMSICRN